MGRSRKVIGKGVRTGQVHNRVLNGTQLPLLDAPVHAQPFGGDSQGVKIGGDW